LSIKLGLPRALLYYEYMPLWKTFFESLGAQIVVSQKTNKSMFDQGAKYCVNEACLPLKIFHAHAASLREKADFIFIPRLRSIKRYEYICPKFTGLPDMIRSSIPDLPPIIDTEINLHKDKSKLMDAFFEAGSFFTADRGEIKSAYQKAVAEHKRYLAQMQKGSLVNDILERKETPQNGDLKIGVMGHMYNLYDEYANISVMKKLLQEKVKITTPEMISQEIIDKKAEQMPKKLFWSFARKLMGAAIYFTEKKNVDGVIYLMSFGCGIDSFIAELCERRLRKSGIPFCLLVLDEHSGQAGVNTRIEAFLDMLRWRRDDESYFSPYGKYLCLGKDPV
jgi:predicted nucleotide-binding protein (sugar kinase/HSP70/actin superfamily)